MLCANSASAVAASSSAPTSAQTPREPRGDRYTFPACRRKYVESSPGPRASRSPSRPIVVPDPGPGRGGRPDPGVRRVPHRPALPRGRDQRRLPVPARPRGRRHRRGGRRRRHRRRARRLRDPQLAGGVRGVPGLPPRRAVVLLRHPQRHAEDDARPTAPCCRRRSASGRSPTRRSSPPASARRSTRRRRRRPPACSAAA